MIRPVLSINKTWDLKCLKFNFGKKLRTINYRFSKVYGKYKIIPVSNKNLNNKSPSTHIPKAVLMGCKNQEKVTEDSSSPAWRGAPCTTHTT